ncbi:MAG: cysteine hydrolase family protein [Oscillospiraceae bacterium]|nr:cysteine hydrolase family protein [Oscillospiraceae bacterium]
MVLLVVDTQEMIMTEELYAFDYFVDHVAKLIVSARQRGVEVIYVRHDDGAELTNGAKGFEIYSRFSPQSNERIFDKHFNSAFRNTGLIDYLNEKDETQIMLVGLQTEYCIDASVKCGFEHGYQMIVPALCNTTVSNDFMTAEQSYKYYNEKIWNRRYANCLGFEEALAML